MRFLWALVAVPVLLVAACGGDDDDGKATTAASENDLAAAMVLTLDELPPDWTSEPAATDDPQEKDPFEECDPGEPEGKTGEADSHDFSPTDTATLSQELTVFQDEDAVQTAFAKAGELADCLEQIVNDGGIDNEQFTYGDASVEGLDIGNVGDDSRGFRVKMTAASIEQPDDEVDIFIDVALLVIDRVGMTVQAADAFSPYDEGDFATFVETAETKVRAVLAQGTP